MNKAELEDALEDALDDLGNAQDALGNAGIVEDVNGHIVVTWIEYPNGRVGLDACGNLSRVELDDLAWEVSL